MQLPTPVPIHVVVLPADQLGVLLRLVEILHLASHHLDFFRRHQVSELGWQMRLGLALRVKIDVALVIHARILIHSPTEEANVVERRNEKLSDLLPLLYHLQHILPSSVVCTASKKVPHLTLKMIFLEFRLLDSDHLQGRGLNIHIVEILEELLLAEQAQDSFLCILVWNREPDLFEQLAHLEQASVEMIALRHHIPQRLAQLLQRTFPNVGPLVAKIDSRLVEYLLKQAQES